LSKFNKALNAKLWLLWYCVTAGTKGRLPVQKKIVPVTQVFEVAFHITNRILFLFPVKAHRHSFLNCDDCTTAGTPVIVYWGVSLIK
jgi:hypothetical protein